MIIGIGSDIVDIRRIDKLIKKYPQKFVERFFSEGEIAAAQNRTANITEFFAKRFAVKEAVAKALGTGFGKHANPKEITVNNTPTGGQAGRPFVQLTGETAKYAQGLAPPSSKVQVLISISDENPYALAFAVISAD